MRFWVRIFLPLALLLVLAAPASAAEDPMREGVRLFQQGRYREAVGAFQRAHAMTRKPAALFNMGRCYEELGEYQSAILSFRRHIKRAPNSDSRQEAEARIEMLQEKIRLQAESPPVVSPPPEVPETPDEPPSSQPPALTAPVPEAESRQSPQTDPGEQATAPSRREEPSRPKPEPHDTQIREGMAFGFSLQGGVNRCGSTCDASAGSLGIELHFGGAVANDALVLVQLWAAGNSAMPNGFGQAFFHVAFQQWFAERFWWRGGLGYGALTLVDVNEAEFTTGGPSLSAGLGFDLIQSGSFALDLQLLFGFGFYGGDNVADLQQDVSPNVQQMMFGLGVNWY